MKQTIIALLMLLSLTASAQETIENPTEGACSMGVPDAVRNYALKSRTMAKALKRTVFQWSRLLSEARFMALTDGRMARR